MDPEDFQTLTKVAIALSLGRDPGPLPRKQATAPTAAASLASLANEKVCELEVVVSSLHLDSQRDALDVGQRALLRRVMLSLMRAFKSAVLPATEPMQIDSCVGSDFDDGC